MAIARRLVAPEDAAVAADQVQDRGDIDAGGGLLGSVSAEVSDGLLRGAVAGWPRDAELLDEARDRGLGRVTQSGRRDAAARAPVGPDVEHDQPRGFLSGRERRAVEPTLGLQCWRF